MSGVESQVQMHVEALGQRLDRLLADQTALRNGIKKLYEILHKVEGQTRSPSDDQNEAIESLAGSSRITSVTAIIAALLAGIVLIVVILQMIVGG